MASKKKAAPKAAPAGRTAPASSRTPAVGQHGVVLVKAIGDEAYRSATFVGVEEDGDYKVHVDLHRTDDLKNPEITVSPEDWHPPGFNPLQGEPVETDVQGNVSAPDEGTEEE